MLIQKKPSRLNIKIAGESGMGIESSGMVVMKALKNCGFWVYGEREFPSLIKGGRANIVINVSDEIVRSSSHKIDISLGLDREGVLDSLETLRPGGILIHGFERWDKVIKNLPEIAKEKNITVYEIPARKIAIENGGNIIMVNVVLLGFLWKILGLPVETLLDRIKIQFTKKPDFLDINFACCRGGYDYLPSNLEIIQTEKLKEANPDSTLKDAYLIDGNSALALGAVSAGVTTYFGYPMSPSSSILTYLAQVASSVGILVKQVEDEITAAQMALGSMHVGGRSLTATSGGGFDLMTETVSLSAMIETPLVVVIAQRPGPATGLPTWTAQADLNLAIYSGHGEYSKCVIAVSDPLSAYNLIQQAFNIAENYQIPVIVLTEATTAMSYFTQKDFSQNDNLKISRGLIIPSSVHTSNLENEKIIDENTKRFQLTENGISPRWLPGDFSKYYYANGDEHWTDGEITEDADRVGQMIQKRNLKNKFLLKDLPEPELFSLNQEFDSLIIGWGSTKRAVIDCLNFYFENDHRVAYLHYEYLWPLKLDFAKKLVKKVTKVFLIEGNYEGQLGFHLEKNGIKFDNKLLKYNGRPFTPEEVYVFITDSLK